jgi:nucleotide-binding universal stress UspA family protein
VVKTVGVGTDGSATADQALGFAIDMAERYGAKLVIISAFKPVDESRLRREQDQAPADIHWSMNPTEDVDGLLSEAVEMAQARGVQTTTVASDGDPASVLCRFAEEQEIDVLIVGSKGMERKMLGSVPNTVSHKAPCSVLIVKTT